MEGRGRLGSSSRCFAVGLKKWRRLEYFLLKTAMPGPHLMPSPPSPRPRGGTAERADVPQISGLPDTGRALCR